MFCGIALKKNSFDKSRSKSDANFDHSLDAYILYPLTLTMTMTMKTRNTQPQPQKPKDPVTVCIPIVYGSIAHHLGKEASETQTHRWTIFLRPHSSNHDANISLESVIDKVVFHLHNSFARPVREVNQPPYQVSECGWGEFEAGIKIHWKQFPGSKVNSKVVTSVVHPLKLYEQIPVPTPTTSTDSSAANGASQPLPLHQQSTNAGAAPVSAAKKPVINEFYDEVVFHFEDSSATDPFYDALVNLNNASRTGRSQEKDQNDTSDHVDKKMRAEGDGVKFARGSEANNRRLGAWPKTFWTDEEHIAILASAQNYINSELNAAKDRILKADAELEDLEKLQSKLDAAKSAAKAAKSAAAAASK